MKLFSNARSKRSTAWMMLLVWVFALASGVANACILDARGTHGRAPGIHASHESAVGNMSSVADCDGDLHALCRRALDDGSLSLLKQPSGPELTDHGLALVLAFAWPVAAPVDSVSGRIDDLPSPVSGRPIRVRYSRLAL